LKQIFEYSGINITVNYEYLNSKTALKYSMA